PQPLQGQQDSGLLQLFVVLAHLREKLRAGKKACLGFLASFDDHHYSHLDLSFVFGSERPPFAPLACSVTKSNETRQNRQARAKRARLARQRPVCAAELLFSYACCRPRMSIFS